MEEGRNAEAETGQRDHWTTGPRDGGATRKHRETTKTIVLWSLQRNPWDALQNDGPSPRPSPHRMGRGRRLGFWRVVAEAANLAVCFSACAATAGDAKFQAAAFYFKRVLTCEIAAGPHCG